MVGRMSDYRPDIEAVTYFRSALERDIEWMEAVAERLSGDVRKGYQKALNLLRYRTLGDESGCVITAFDRRGPKLLDDDGPL